MQNNVSASASACDATRRGTHALVGEVAAVGLVRHGGGAAQAVERASSAARARAREARGAASAQARARRGRSALRTRAGQRLACVRGCGAAGGGEGARVCATLNAGLARMVWQALTQRQRRSGAALQHSERKASG
jgi:hypothetical protein